MGENTNFYDPQTVANIIVYRTQEMLSTIYRNNMSQFGNTFISYFTLFFYKLGQYHRI